MTNATPKDCPIRVSFNKWIVVPSTRCTNSSLVQTQLLRIDLVPQKTSRRIQDKCFSTHRSPCTSFKKPPCLKTNPAFLLNTLYKLVICLKTRCDFSVFALKSSIFAPDPAKLASFSRVFRDNYPYHPNQTLPSVIKSAKLLSFTLFYGGLRAIFFYLSRNIVQIFVHPI